MEVETDPQGMPLVTLTAREWPAVVEELVEAWPILAQSFREYVTSHPEREWDRMRLYMRLDAGMVYVAPDPLEIDRYVDVGAFYIHHLEALYAELPDSDDEDVFNAAHGVLAEDLLGALRKAALSPGARESLAGLQGIKAFDITAIEYDDYETERVLVPQEELV